MSFLGLLTVVFIVLKLVGVISWPWLAVFAPMIFAWVLFFSLVALVAWTKTK